MAATHYLLTQAQLNIGGSQFEGQISEMTVSNDTKDGETVFTFGGDASSFVEPKDAKFTLELKAFADWTLGGISDFLWTHDGEEVSFQLDHHPNEVGSHVRFTGTVQIKAPSAGGEVRTTEETEASLSIVGTPTYSRIG